MRAWPTTDVNAVQDLLLDWGRWLSGRGGALCTVDRDGNETTLELNPGWWQKGRSGRAPIAID